MAGRYGEAVCGGCRAVDQTVCALEYDGVVNGDGATPAPRLSYDVAASSGEHNASADGDASALAVVVAAASYSRAAITTLCGYGSAADGDVCAIAVTGASYSRAALATLCGYGSAADGDACAIALSPRAVSYSCATRTALCCDIPAANGDARTSLFAAAPYSRAAVAACDLDSSTLDIKFAGRRLYSGVSRCDILYDELAHNVLVGRLAFDRQRLGDSCVVAAADADAPVDGELAVVLQEQDDPVARCGHAVIYRYFSLCHICVVSGPSCGLCRQLDLSCPCGGGGWASE